ncbi:MAG: O-antigen ligase family protein [bacterium]|nr:O-antigen ligase family protein [bacterium]
MILNSIFAFFQRLNFKLYKNSFVLKNIDWFIFISILLVILFSTFAPSDNIGYFAIFGILLTLVKLLTKPNAKLRFSIGDLFLLIYFLIVLISVAGSTLLMFSIKGFCKTIIYLGFYITVVNYLKTNRSKIKYILIAVALAALGESFVAMHQNFLSVSEISGWQDVTRLNPEEIMTRVYGTLKPYNPNLFGGYMLGVIPSTLILFFLPLFNKHYKTAVLGLGIFGLSVVSLVLTGCRGAYIGLFFELVLLAIFTYKFLKPVYKKLFLILAGVFTSVATLIVFSVASLRARVISIFAMRSDSSNSFRFNVYNSCFEMFKDNWLLGIGVGNQNFREIYGLYMRTGFDALSAYNIYLETSVESGIFALLAFLGFIFTNIIGAVRYILRRKNINTVYVLLALVSIVGLLLHGFVDTVFFRPQLQFIFWIMIAIIRVLAFGRGLSINGRSRN